MQLKPQYFQSKILDKLKARLCACGNELFGTVAETLATTISALAYATVHQIAVLDRIQLIRWQRTCIKTTPKTFRLCMWCFRRMWPRYRIIKYLYGLPHAGRAYYRAYSGDLISEGYLRVTSDPCLFVKLDGSLKRFEEEVT
jgi:hypothetical protein